MREPRRCCDCGRIFQPAAVGQASPRCRPCARKAAQKKWAEQNPDVVHARNLKFYADNRERERARAKAWRDANSEKAKKYFKNYRETHKEERAVYAKAWYQDNQEVRSRYRKTQYVLNKERENALSRLYKENNKKELARKQATYLREHPEYNRYARSIRRAAEKRATPSWVDKKLIREIYAMAVDLSITTNIQHHVDHIFPLNPRSKTMCGLHVPWNLQILPAEEHWKKSDNHWPPQPCD